MTTATTTIDQPKIGDRDVRQLQYCFAQNAIMGYHDWLRHVKTHYESFEQCKRRSRYTEDVYPALEEDWDEAELITFEEAGAIKDPILRRAAFIAVRPDRVFADDRETEVVNEFKEKVKRQVLGADLQYTEQEVERHYQIRSLRMTMGGEDTTIFGLVCFDTSDPEKKHVLLTQSQEVNRAMVGALTSNPWSAPDSRIYRHGDILFFDSSKESEGELGIYAEDMYVPGMREAVEAEIAGYEFSLVLDLNLGTTRHTLYCPEKIEYDRRDSDITLKLSADAYMLHPEHEPIKLPAGEYSVRVMQEFDPWRDSMVNVFD